MATPRISFREPLFTRKGSPVKLYRIFPKELHGAYYIPEEDRWYICRWEYNGYFNPPYEGKQYITSLDLINKEESINVRQTA